MAFTARAAADRCDTPCLVSSRVRSLRLGGPGSQFAEDRYFSVEHQRARREPYDRRRDTDCERRNKQAKSENDREPDPPHQHLGGMAGGESSRPELSTVWRRFEDVGQAWAIEVGSFRVRQTLSEFHRRQRQAKK